MSIKKMKIKSNHFRFPDLFKRLKSVVILANIKILYVGIKTEIPNKVLQVSPSQNSQFMNIKIILTGFLL